MEITEESGEETSPEGWRIVRLSTIAELINGDRSSNYPSKRNLPGSTIPFINAGNLIENKISLDECELITEAQYAAITSGKTESGDILFCLRGSLGKQGLVDRPLKAAIASSLVIVRSTAKSTSKYLSFFLRSHLCIKQIGFANNGTAQPNLGARSLADFDIPLPPLPEQERIAARLDLLFEKLKAARARLDAIPDLIKRFRKSVLAEAVSGRLTEEWREEHAAELPSAEELLAQVRKERRKAWEKDELAKMRAKGKVPKDDAWKKRNAEDLELIVTAYDSCGCPHEWISIKAKFAFSLITDGEHLSPPKQDSGVPLITAKDVKENGLSFEDTQYVSEKTAALAWRRCRPLPGDSLVCSRGTIGRTTLIEDSRPFCLMGSVILLRPGKSILPRYGHYLLRSEYCQSEFQSRNRATAVSALYLSEAEEVLVSIPSLEEQREIVRRVDELFAYADALEARVTAASALADRLEPAILAKAFRGELSEQLPEEAAEWEKVLADIEKSATVLGMKLPAKRGRKAKETAIAPDAKPTTDVAKRKRGRPRKQ